MGQRRKRRRDRGGKINTTEEDGRMTRGVRGKGGKGKRNGELERVTDAEESIGKDEKSCEILVGMSSE